LDLNGNDIGNQKGLLAWLLGNVHRCRGKMQAIIKEVELLRIVIASITETKKKVSGSEVVGNYLHFCSCIPKENTAKRGISLLIHKEWKHSITNWQSIDE
jgi:hypothetical protein